MKTNLWLVVAMFVLFCVTVSGEINRKTEIETVATEVKTEYYELAGLGQQYFGICMEALCLYEKYQKEVGASADEINELKKETADLPDKIEYFLNKPDLLDKEIGGLDFNNAEECQYALNILSEMSVALKGSIIQFKAQITVKNCVLLEIKKKIIIPEIKERFAVIKKETNNLVTIHDNLIQIYHESLTLMLKYQKELGVSIEKEIQCYLEVINNLRGFNEDLKIGLSVLDNGINNLLDSDKYEKCAAFMDNLEKVLVFIYNEKKFATEKIVEAAANLESLKQYLGGGSCPNE